MPDGKGQKQLLVKSFESFLKNKTLVLSKYDLKSINKNTNGRKK